MARFRRSAEGPHYPASNAPRQSPRNRLPGKIIESFKALQNQDPRTFAGGAARTPSHTPR